MNTTLTLGETPGNTTGTYDLGGYNQTIASLFSQGTGGVANVVTNSSSVSDSELTMSNGGTFAGMIQDGATKKTRVTVAGGTLELTGSNTFTGATLITSGTLKANASRRFAGRHSGIRSTRGGTLLLGGSNQINDWASVNLTVARSTREAKTKRSEH